MFNKTSIVVSYVLVILTHFVHLFNIEDRLPLIKTGPPHSLFGLSVAQHHISSNPSTTEDIVILVGAPTANVSTSITSGALYRCNISNFEKCEQVLIDQGISSEQRDWSEEWLGVNVASQKPGGRVTVCGHRYTNRGVASGKGIFKEQLAGRCYLFTNTLTYQPNLKQAPCDGEEKAFSDSFYGYCQAGTSFAFYDNSEEDIVIGTPGIFSWSGGVSVRALSPNNLFEDNFLWLDQKNNSISKNSYVGFSVAIGNISGLDFAAGAPRAYNNGAVILYKKKNTGGLLLNEIVKGEKFASSFGYTVKIFDITGDGLDDLIVGAPQYYDRERKIGGAVYIYVNKLLNTIGPNPTNILYGDVDSSFGTSITNLGDINKDGINDIAVGAPGADEGFGKVFIYHGSSDPNVGVNKLPTQILSGKNISVDNRNVTGFGYSLSGNLDMDLNGYPDLTVGSLADFAVLYRTRPIINVNAFINASVNQVDINASVLSNPNVYIVSVHNQTNKLVAFNVSVCMIYMSSPSFNDHVKIKYTITLDAKKIEDNLLPRASFVPLSYNNRTKTKILELSKQSDLKCDSFPVYLDKDMQDKLSPFVLAVTYNIVEKKPKRKQGNSKVVSMKRYPILNKNKPNFNSTQVNISKNCGSDEICQSNLSFSAAYVVLINGEWKPLELNEDNVPLLLVGTEDGIGINVSISNYKPGEDAHQAKFKMMLPNVFNYTEFVPLTNTAKTVSCSESSLNDSSLLECNLGNPFRADSILSMILVLENDQEAFESSEVIINMTVSTSSKQKDLGFIPFRLSVRVQANLNINGYSIFEQMPYSGKVTGESAVKSVSDAGLEVIHAYDLANYGTTQVDHVYVTITWPYAISNGKWLLYLLSANVTGLQTNNGSQCFIPSSVNDPLGLEKKDGVRKKRELQGNDKDPNEPAPISQSSDTILKCPSTAKCVHFNCTIDSIMPAQTVYIYIHAVVWNSTFLEEYNTTTLVRVFSSATVQVNLNNVLYANSSVQNAEVSTTMLSENVLIEEESVEFWIIVVASFAGVVLLVIIILILWRCGFFRRRKDFGDFHTARKHRQASKKADEMSDRLMY